MFLKFELDAIVCSIKQTHLQFMILYTFIHLNIKVYSSASGSRSKTESKAIASASGSCGISGTGSRDAFLPNKALPNDTANSKRNNKLSVKNFIVLVLIAANFLIND